MTLTAAMEEAYAQKPRGESVIETLEIDHVTFSEPVLIATGVQEDILLPLALGEAPQLHKALQLSVTPPGHNEDGFSPMRVRIDNVSSFLLPYIRDALQSTTPASVTYRAYTTSDLTQPGDIIPGLELRVVSLDPVSATAQVGFREIELQAFPLRTYDSEYYPALQTS